MTNLWLEMCCYINTKNKACRELKISSYKINLICEGKLKPKNGIILKYGKRN